MKINKSWRWFEIYNVRVRGEIWKYFLKVNWIKRLVRLYKDCKKKIEERNIVSSVLDKDLILFN